MGESVRKTLRTMAWAVALTLAASVVALPAKAQAASWPPAQYPGTSDQATAAVTVSYKGQTIYYEYFTEAVSGINVAAQQGETGPYDVTLLQECMMDPSADEAYEYGLSNATVNINLNNQMLLLTDRFTITNTPNYPNVAGGVSFSGGKILSWPVPDDLLHGGLEAVDSGALSLDDVEILVSGDDVNFTPIISVGDYETEGLGVCELTNCVVSGGYSGESVDVNGGGTFKAQGTTFSGMGKYNITLQGGKSEAKASQVVLNDCDLSGSMEALRVYENDDVQGYGTLTVGSGTNVECDGGSFGTIQMDGGTLNVEEGATIGGATGDSTMLTLAAYVSGGTLNVLGGTVSAKTALTNAGGTVNISGGTVSGEGIGVFASGGITNISGGAVTNSVSGEASGFMVPEGTTAAPIVAITSESSPQVSITGGTFTNTASGGQSVWASSGHEDAIQISGGTFSPTAPPSSCLTPGYSLTELGNGTYTVTAQSAPEGTVTVWRLFNRWASTHLYTTDTTEVATNVAAGWENEGPYWYAPTKGSGDYTIVRLYNQYNGDHYYVPESDTTQINGLLAAGWQKDSDASWFDSAPKDSPYPIYTLFNPYSKVDTHLYTPKMSEVDANVALGWQENTTVIWAASLPE